MALVKLNNVEITPTPFINITMSSEFKEDGTVKKTVRNIELKGKIIAYDPVIGKPGIGFQRGSVDTDAASDAGYPSKIITKMAAHEALVTQKIDKYYIEAAGVSIPTISSDGTTDITLKSKSFQLEANSLICDYTIVFEQIIKDSEEINESWSLQPSDEYDRFVKVDRTRSIQLKNKTVGGVEKKGWELGLEKLTPSVYNAASIGTYISGIPTGNEYGKATNYSVNTEKNTVECTESWTISDLPYTVELTTTSKKSSESFYNSASMQGTITGYGKNKFTEANTYYQTIKKWVIGDTFSIPNAGLTNARVKSVSEGINKTSGVITFSVDVSEGIEEDGERYKSITYTDTPPTDLYATIPAVGKPEGPIIQKIKGKKNGVKTVTVEVLYSDGSNKPPDVADYAPTGTSFVEKDDSTFDYSTRKVTRSVVWNYK
jgi:hypothetical protein